MIRFLPVVFYDRNGWDFCWLSSWYFLSLRQNMLLFCASYLKSSAKAPYFLFQFLFLSLLWSYLLCSYWWWLPIHAKLAWLWWVWSLWDWPNDMNPQFIVLLSLRICLSRAWHDSFSCFRFNKIIKCSTFHHKNSIKFRRNKKI